MAARCVIVIARDETIARELTSTLERVVDGGVVRQALDEPTIDTEALRVVYVDAELADRVRVDPSLLISLDPGIVVWPGAELADVVSVMSGRDGVLGVMTTTPLDAAAVAAMASHVLGANVLRLEDLLAPGTTIHTHAVGDYKEKLRCMSALSQFAGGIGVSTSRREPIVQAVDELLMNALYSAPVNARGEPIFADVDTRARTKLRTDRTVSLRFGCDRARFVVAVHDEFGSLTRGTVLRHLYRGTFATHQVDTKRGGAGLGIYLTIRAATAMHFDVIPGGATKVTGVFELGPGERPTADVSFVTRAPAETPARPARRLRAGSRAVRGLVAAAVAVAALVLAVVAWRVVFPPPTTGHVVFETTPAGATLELDGRTLGVSPTAMELDLGRTYQLIARLDGHDQAQTVVRARAGELVVRTELRPQAIVELDTRPTGAMVEIAGKPVGTTPLRVTEFEPGTTLAVTAARTGYRTASMTAVVPARGEVLRLVQDLEVSNELVRVRFVSTPPGAEVVRKGAPPSVERTYTPAELFVAPDETHEFTLVMARHVPLVIEPFTVKRGDREVERGGVLEPGVILRVETSQPGTVTVSGAPHCTRLEAPIECTVKPGSYAVEYSSADAKANVQRRIVVERDVVERIVVE